MCILCIALNLTATHVVHALRIHAELQTGPPNTTLHPRTSRSASTSSQRSHGPELAETTVAPVLPFVTADAIVTGEVHGGYDTDAAASWAGAARGLLHGKRRPSKYSQCNVCTVISCNKAAGICSGHCKKRRRLFTCRTSSGVTRVAGSCGSVNPPDPLSLEADPLEPRRTVEVAASAPFIGCANITGLPNACPAEGTRGILDGGLEFTVVRSSCEQYLYNLTCTQENSKTPFHPFGYCFCAIEYDGGGRVGGPCRLFELNYTAPRLRESDGVPISVYPEGNMTVTMYGERGVFDVRLYSYDTVFELGSVTVHAHMGLWEGVQDFQGMNLTLDGPLEDYH